MATRHFWVGIPDTLRITGVMLLRITGFASVLFARLWVFRKATRGFFFRLPARLRAFGIIAVGSFLPGSRCVLARAKIPVIVITIPGFVVTWPGGGDASLVLHEKGGRERRIPCHHRTRDAVRVYLAATGLLEQSGKVPLFQTARARSGKISGTPMHRRDVLAMVKRRCKAVGLPASICNHSFRATGITIHQENGGRLEDAQELAGHADPRTTQLYNRKNRTVARAEVERVQL